MNSYIRKFGPDPTGLLRQAPHAVSYGGLCEMKEEIMLRTCSEHQIVAKALLIQHAATGFNGSSTVLNQIQKKPNYGKKNTNYAFLS